MSQPTADRPVYRMAQPADIAALVELFNLSNAGDSEIEWAGMVQDGETWREAAARQMADEAAEISYRWAIVAVVEGEIAGMLMANPHPASMPQQDLSALAPRYRPFALLKQMTEGCLYLRNMAVFPHYQGMGLASALLDVAIFGGWKMRAEAIAAIVHDSNVVLLQHYKKRGFEVFDTAPIQDHAKFPVGSLLNLLIAPPHQGFLPGSYFAQEAASLFAEQD